MMTYAYRGREITTSSNKNLKYAVLRMREETVLGVIGCRSSLSGAKGLLSTERGQLKRIMSGERLKAALDQLKIVEIRAIG